MTLSLGASPFHLLRKVLLPESLSYIIYGISQTLVQLIGFSLILGILGAGGLGKLLINSAYQHYHIPYIAGILGIILVLIIGLEVLGRILSCGTIKMRPQP